MKLEQVQTQSLTQQQLQSLHLLGLSVLELEAYVRELALENPFVEPEETQQNAPASAEDPLDRLRWLEETDRQNQFYQQVTQDELDPLARIGTDGGLGETLLGFIARQIEKLHLNEDTRQIVCNLAACLDEDGYLRISKDELAENFSVTAEKMGECIKVLQSLEPAGVGAASLSQCLSLQLRRAQISGTALAIVEQYLDLLGRRHYRAIAAKLHVSLEDVRLAQQIIKQLQPRPGAIFQPSEAVHYVLPDVFITQEQGRFVARMRNENRPPFQINAYYRSLLKQSDIPQVKEYLTDKLRQANYVMWAVGQRESTLLRCAQAIADAQTEFFRFGARALAPLRMAEVAQELAVHESTISRAVREKYLQCAHGLYPMGYFFSRPASTDETQCSMGSAAAKELLRQLINGEDKTAPLSDQKLCQRMAAQKCPISRRTVAKYRDELGIPSAGGRKC